MGINRGRTTNWNVLKTSKDFKPHNVVKLEHVLGLTVTSNSALDCDTKTGIIAYPAGCTIVFLSPYREKQTHLLNDSRKSVTCLTYSPDGRYLATGEYGHQPSIRIWDLSDNSRCYEFTDHKCGINCLAFSPNQKYLVSVGSQHDMIINVWDWRSRIKIGANKVSTKIKAVAFCETGDYFVTVGNRHVKFWYIQHSKQSLNKDQPGLIGRAAILGEQQNNDFVDVVCGKGDFQDMTYVISRSGVLCEFNGRRLLDRWVNVKTSCAFCITGGDEYLFIGCSESIIRCFSVSTLAFVTTLPRTHYLGVDVAKALNISHTASHPKDARYPDAIAVIYDDVHKKLACVYNDHSLYVWDIHDIRKVGKSNSYLYHCACIWGVETYPELENSVMPSGSFITCSSDDTVRVWNLDKQRSNYDADCPYQANIYSNELLKVIYIDPELQYIKNTDIGLTDKSENPSYDDRNGVRSMGISPDGQQLATGDRSGNIRVYGLKSIDEVCKIEAHDAEVLCLEYAPIIPNSNKRLLLSASRDRLIHVFDASDYYKFVETLDDHSSSITAIRFIDMNNQLQLVSCSADKSIIFRRYQNGKNAHFVRDRLLTGKSTLYDMAVDCTQKYVLTACQDRCIRVYNVNNGKQCKSFKGSVGEEGSVIKVALDHSGRYLATSCTDKTLCVFDYYSGECIACICGHSELVTGLRFSNDCERLISASGDGCIFVWRLPRDMVVTMQTRIAQQRARSSAPKSPLYDNSEDPMNEVSITTHIKADIGREISGDIRFNDGQLPLWVTKSVNEESTLISESNSRKMMPKGRWAQRLTPFAQDGILNLPSSRESDGSKEDSSVDSGTETSRPEDRHEKLIVPQKMIRSPPKFITVEDGSDRLDGNLTDNMGYRRSNSSNLSDLQDIHRVRQHTDDSSLGSFKNEDVESIEHDGDIEDYSEVESADNGSNNKVIYYQTVDDALSEFKVNAIDADELRKSQRKIKRTALAKKNPSLNVDVTNYSVSGSQESDDDDDEGGSTPSADNSEKANSLTLSSVDAFIQREKYLKGTYESLSGMETDTKHNSEYPDKKSTISSKHHSYNVEYRNQKIIQATIQNKNDMEATRKRQELQSRLEDIRGKLECAGTYSSLRSSQSTMDLRRNETYFAPMASRKVNDFQGTRSPTVKDNDKLTYYSKNRPIDSVNEYFVKLSESMPRVSNGYLLKKCNNDRPGTINEVSQLSRPNALGVRSVHSARSPHLQNYSLPHSPVCEREFADKSRKRSSCCFYVDFNGVESAENGDRDDHYSSDSLDDGPDEEAESDATPRRRRRRRRCVSEYQLSWRDSPPNAYRQQAEDEAMRSHWNSSLTDINRSHSEENILNDDDDVDSLLDHSDRHSSASFFLRCKRKAFNSSESILTDESEYQFLFSNHSHASNYDMGHHRDTTFHSTESVLTDISDSNLNSASDDQNLADEITCWSRMAPKKPVLRTRSLQDSKSHLGGELTRHFVAHKENGAVSSNRSCDKLDSLTAKTKPKNESFFIPVDGSAANAPRSPEEVKELFRRKMDSRKRTEKSTQSDGNKQLEHHPLVTHKPPKPQNRSGAHASAACGNPKNNVGSAYNCKTYRKNKPPAKAPAQSRRNDDSPDEKYGTFTKSKASLGKNLLKNHFQSAKNATSPKITNVVADRAAKTEYRVWTDASKAKKKSAVSLKRATTITKYDATAPNTRMAKTDGGDSKDDKLFKNVLLEMRNKMAEKRHSLPATFVSLSQLTSCTGGSSSDAVSEDSGVGMRRSISLSDLSPSSMLNSPNNQKKMGDKYFQKHKEVAMHTSTPFNSPMSRSSSEISLMPPPSAHYRRQGRQNESNPAAQRVMRPTISSQNKIKSSSSMKHIPSSGRRRSTVSISYTLNDGNLEDSSSEDNKSDRPRSSFSEKQFAKGSKFMERSCSERDLSVLSHASSKKRNHMMNEARSEAQLFNSTLLDVTNTPISRDLLNAVVEQFKKTADNIIRMHDRIAVENINDSEKKVLLSSLRNTVGQVQSALRFKLDCETQNEFHEAMASASESLTSLPHDENMKSMIKHYSEALVSIVQQKFDKKPA